MLLHQIRLQEERGQQVTPGLRGASDGPLRRRGQEGSRRELHRLHHLPDVAVGQHHHGVAVLIGKIESQGRQVGHFLHRGGRQHQDAVVAVAAALDDLVVIALLGRDVSQPRTGAHDVRDHARQLRSGDVANTLLHQADARPAGGGQGAHTRRRGAVKHVDGRHFTLGLQEHAAGLRQVERRLLGDFAGRRDGVPVIRPAARQDRGLHDGFISLAQLFPHRFSPCGFRQPPAAGPASGP